MSGEKLVRIKRSDGTTFLLAVPEEHVQRVIELAKGDFGDKSVVLDGPKPIAPDGR